MTEKEIDITCIAGSLCKYYNMGSTIPLCLLKSAICQFQRPLIYRDSGLDRKRVMNEIRDWGDFYLPGGKMAIDYLIKRIEKL